MRVRIERVDRRCIHLAHEARAVKPTVHAHEHVSATCWFARCSGDGVAQKNPLCQQGGTYGTTQYGAKGYPGTRHLAVLKGLGDQAIVASICPANLTDASKNDYGYRPAIGSIISRKLGARGSVPPYICLPKMPNSGSSAYLGPSAAPFAIEADPSAPRFAISSFCRYPTAGCW